MLVFGSTTNIQPSIYVNGTKVPVCESTMHLGKFVRVIGQYFWNLSSRNINTGEHLRRTAEMGRGCRSLWKTKLLLPRHLNGIGGSSDGPVVT